MKYCPLCRSELAHRNIDGRIRLGCARLIGHFPLAQLNQLVIAYEIRAEGELTLGDEIAEVKVVSPTELATFDFGPLSLTSEIVSIWLQRERRASA